MDFVIIWEAEVLSNKYHGHDKHTGIDKITRDTTDISEWIEVDFMICYDVLIPHMNGITLILEGGLVCTIGYSVHFDIEC